MNLPLIFSFWFMVAAYVIHVIDESLLGGSFVEKVQQGWWPKHSWRKFFWFNAGYFVIMIASVVAYDLRGGSWLNNCRCEARDFLLTSVRILLIAIPMERGIGFSVHATPFGPKSSLLPPISNAPATFRRSNSANIFSTSMSVFWSSIVVTTSWKEKLEREIRNFTQAIAESGHSKYILEEISVREKEISGITNRLLSSTPDSIQTQIEELRRLVEGGIQNLQSLFREESPAAKQELRRHLSAVLMFPLEDGEGWYYIAEGEWNLLGTDPHEPKVRVVPVEGVFGWLRGMDLNHQPLGYEEFQQLTRCGWPSKNLVSAVKESLLDS
jgi:hypothetical protein